MEAQNDQKSINVKLLACKKLNILILDCEILVKRLNNKIEIKFYSENDRELSFVYDKYENHGTYMILFSIESNEYIINMVMEKDLKDFINWLDKDKKRLVTTITDINVIEESYKIQIKSNPSYFTDASSYLLDKIKHFIKNFDCRHYGLFTTICQSSGFGKSRACTELSKNAYVAYCCMRSINSSGYPKRTPSADKLLTKNGYTKVESNFYYYIKYFIDLLKQNHISTEKFYELSQHDFDFSKNNSENNIQKLTWSENEKPLIFVFDEARGLLDLEIEAGNKTTPYFFILRSIISLFMSGNMFFLFVDTNSKLSNFMPPKNKDPSQRLIDSRSICFEPIYLLPNWDVFTNLDNIKNINDSLKFEIICKFGRPLWGSWYETKSKDESSDIDNDHLIKLAYQKLVGGHSKKIVELTDLDYLAILSCRLGTIKPISVETSHELVATNMAICTFVNPINNFVEIEYPSEPILAEASARYMSQVSFSSIANEVFSLVKTSYVDQGEIGELMTKLLLLNAIDKAVKKSSNENRPFKHLNKVMLSCFIENLYGRQGIELIEKKLSKENSKKLLNSYLNFSHFIRSSKFSNANKKNDHENFLNKNDLANMLKRGSAVQCRKNQIGIDFIIPLTLNQENFDELSAILIQVKLRKKSITANITHFNQMKLDQHFIINDPVPYLAIFIDLDAEKDAEISLGNINMSTIETKEMATKKPKTIDFQATIYSKGISKTVYSLEDSEIEALNNFCNYNTTLTDNELVVHNNIRNFI